nr:hypothetical protein CFP56_36234 [Quercus suber]
MKVPLVLREGEICAPASMSDAMEETDDLDPPNSSWAALMMPAMFACRVRNGINEEGWGYNGYGIGAQDFQKPRAAQDNRARVQREAPAGVVVNPVCNHQHHPSSSTSYVGIMSPTAAVRPRKPVLQSLLDLDALFDQSSVAAEQVLFFASDASPSRTISPGVDSSSMPTARPLLIIVPPPLVRMRLGCSYSAKAKPKLNRWPSQYNI